MATKAEVEAENAELKEQLEGKVDPVGDVDPNLTIHQRLAAIARELPPLIPQDAPGGGIKFKYRGVDATVAHVTPLLNKYQVFAAPNLSGHLITERDFNGGRVQKTAQVEVEYRFFGPAGDYVSVITPGLADDLADRSTAQAMSVAYRIALLQLFHIPAFGEDPEESGEKVMQARTAQPNAKIATAQAAASKPAGPDPAKQMRDAIAAAAQVKGMDGAAMNALGLKVTGKAAVEDWWENPEDLNKILIAING